jgi:protein-S-isoprenylcysteine O-methyltransferase Ste14
MGNRGEGWVVLQGILFAIIFITQKWSFAECPLIVRIAGLIILILGGSIGTWGVFDLGRNISPFPKPKQTGTLVTGGIYSIVRHPIYGGLIIGTFGWSLLVSNLLGIPMSLVLFIFFDAKSRREERWLFEKFPEYAEYSRRVKKLIPWLY